MVRIAIVVGSTRPGRTAARVAEWVHEVARERGDAEFEVVDIADHDLPLLDEPMPPAAGRYSRPHTIAWSAVIDRFDGYVFVTPEYNRSTSAALKNAIDFLYREWNGKAAGFVGYGNTGGARAIEHLRTIMAELQVADVREQVSLSVFDDFVNWTDLAPRPRQLASLQTMLDQVVAWSDALRPLRAAV
jgi:NAD(P)H-dependent FMN reductase